MALPPAATHAHYESAFAEGLRRVAWPFVRVDEQRRALLEDVRVKSFDFLVYPDRDRKWLVDIKGRHFPYVSESGHRYWENWVTREDIEGMRAWQAVFGDEYEGMFVFAYLIRDECRRPLPGPACIYGGDRYCFMAASAQRYGELARMRSPRWDTVSMSATAFRSISSPLFETAREAPAPALQAATAREANSPAPG